MISEYKPLLQFKTSDQRYQYALLRIYQQYRPKHCFIAKFIQSGEQAKVLCHLKNGKLADSFVYGLTDTPCDQAAKSNQVCIYESNIQQHFPKDHILKQWQIESYLATALPSQTQKPNGILVCLFDHEFSPKHHNLQRFKELSYIIGAELDHQLAFIKQRKLVDQLDTSERLTKRGSLSWQLDQNRINCSLEFYHIFQLNSQQPITLDKFYDLVCEKDRKTVIEKVQSLINGQNNNIELTFTTIELNTIALHKTKQIQLHGVFEFDVDTHSNIVHINVQDITNTYLLNKRLQLSNFVFEHTSEAIMITDSRNLIVSVNKALEQITGYHLEELLGQDPGIFSSGRHDEHFYRQMWSDLFTKGYWKGEVYNKRKDGQIFPEELSLNVVRNENNEVTNYVAIFRDITERKATEKQLTFYANNEPLTGLTNRRSFIDNIEHHISIAKRHNAPFSVVFFDLDRFKEINDVHGHNIGDELLRGIADRVLLCVRKEDIVCRYGGDEFTLLLVNTEMDQAGFVAEKIQQTLHQPFDIDGIAIEVTTSMGIAQYPDSGLDATTILRNASHAMASVKATGRNNIAFHNNELQATYLFKLELRNKLKLAINQQQLQVYYQPIIDLTKNQITKFEALVRWKDEKGEFISPGIFIAIAEEFGYIQDIGQFVLEQACIDLKTLHNLGHQDIQFSINRSIAEFSDDVDEAEQICQTINNYQLPSKSIVIEVTESVAMSSNKQTEKVLADLKRNGVAIALDDFCTGYSSLSNLIEYRSDFLKIDKSFIDKLTSKKKHQILISSLIDMATKLDMFVVAEGVEQQEQVDLLKEFGCHYVQGFYFSPAKPLNLCIEMLNNPLKP